MKATTSGVFGPKLRRDRLQKRHRPVGGRLLGIPHRLHPALLERVRVFHHLVPVGLAPCRLLELDEVELSQERRRRPVIGQDRLFLEIRPLDGRRERATRAGPEIGEVFFQPVGAQLHRVE